ncbi:MAG: hypothetical protein IPG56_09015 [Caulobacteraceae bacterium]|nr:hypothetical protein [Caulobacteraceae bacterium]
MDRRVAALARTIKSLAIAFAPDGSVVVVGQDLLSPERPISAGGVDAYVRGYSASGLELFTRQFGTGGADAATALLVRDNGAGGIDIFTGGVENNRGVVRSFSYSGHWASASARPAISAISTKVRSTRSPRMAHRFMWAAKLARIV